jgi:hypothetical protein
MPHEAAVLSAASLHTAPMSSLLLRVSILSSGQIIDVINANLQRRTANVATHLYASSASET